MSDRIYKNLTAAKRPSQTDGGSEIDRALSAQKAEADAKVNYQESDDFFRLQAQELKRRITIYSNLGLTDLKNMAEQEAQKLIVKYQKLVAKNKLKGLATDTTA
ncbi:MAG: hypothetical protein KGQ41_09710 [Alphaproteobacteria bacterium]|nr:hypothetical protein [Alphaproteobacteria bacterium]